MKRSILAVFMLTMVLWAVENTNIAGLEQFKPDLTATVFANEYILHWSKLPYPAYYEVEVLRSPPASDHSPVPAQQRITSYHTWQNQLVINRNFPFHTYWRVSAQGLFLRPLGLYSDPIKLSEIAGGSSGEELSPIKPLPTSVFIHGKPVPDKPVLTWTSVPGAVYYEIEFLSSLPENPNDINPSRYQIASSREVFTNGYNADLSWYAGNKVYWRVRALDYDGNPIGVYSDASPVYIDHTLPQTLKPVITTVFNQHGTATPLYPVYSWIPVTGAVSYEVEVMDQPPENPNGTEPSRHRIWSKENVTGFDCYDEEPRLTSGIYYWRVRGFDAQGNAVGIFSDAGRFVVDLNKGNYAATLGDSITHGGGAISYSPANWEYDYQTYLAFPAVNLGRSGDTAEDMAKRFDRDVLPFKPRFLLILGGTNSLRGGVPAGEVIDELTLIRDKAFQHGIRPIFLTLPPINPAAIAKAFNEETAPDWREEFDTVNAFIRRQRYYIDLDPYFCDAARELPDRYAIDGLHLDIEGKKLMAQIINANWTRVTQ
ncbi:Hypothetical protein LUCI_4001 [Lucifera butyrica]|uniref:SGNH hydrolase-type esterase domain-containing protein n=1 Tax=Lucifera butyrica TaxID=1351585 RepID=A0A498RF57_9FIRM|nr:GDSL-type esterase/lipase family protein [Lucifera butyrica]VBB08723.1 Hypothetical protein LUCI_4001 [Lucifera butyrica]